VRLSPLQVALYRKYLELHVQTQEDGSVVKGVSLFSDYQNLMRIWTHPWVLRLDEIRQEKRVGNNCDCVGNFLLIASDYLGVPLRYMCILIRVTSVL